MKEWLNREVGGQEGLLNRYERVAVLKSMSVEEDIRGEGLGSQLLDDWIEEASESGAEAVFLIADKSEDNKFDLQKWYESRGFKKVVNTSSGPFMVLAVMIASMANALISFVFFFLYLRAAIRLNWISQPLGTKAQEI